MQASDEVYTPAYVIDCVREALGGGIDFDPCTSEEANKVVGASVWMNREVDCLKQEWISERAFKRAVRFFMNPPYSRPASFIERFFEWERRNDTSAIVLVNNSTDTAWFRKLVTYADAVWFPPRIKFDRVINGVRQPIPGGNRYAQALVAFGIDPEHFFKSMKPLGGWGARL